MSQNRGSSGSVIAGLGLLAMLGRYCDDAARVFSHTDDLGHMTQYVDDAGRVSSYGDDIGRGLHIGSEAEEAKAAVRPGGTVSARTGNVDEGLGIGNRGVEGDPRASIPDPPIQGFQQLGGLDEKAVAGGRVRGESLELTPLRFAPGVNPNTVVESPHLLVLFPANSDEFLNVYGSAPTVSASSKIKALNSRFEIEADLTRLQRHREVAEFLGAHHQSSPIVVLAHSENAGRIIVLPSGERIAAGISTDCAMSQARNVFY